MPLSSRMFFISANIMRDFEKTEEKERNSSRHKQSIYGELLEVFLINGLQKDKSFKKFHLNELWSNVGLEVLIALLGLWDLP